MRFRRISLTGPALFAMFGAATISLPLASLPAFARAPENLAVATPFEVGESPAGNYLAAIVAGAERDTVAAATFSREALRSDPRNSELIERAFVAAVSNGNMNEAFGLADRLVAREPNNGLARLILGIKALKAKQFSNARGAIQQWRQRPAARPDLDPSVCLVLCRRRRDEKRPTNSPIGFVRRISRFFATIIEP